MILSDYKTCSKCNRLLKKEAFYIDKNSSDGLLSRCVSCIRSNNKKIVNKTKIEYNKIAKYEYKYGKKCKSCNIIKSKLGYYNINDDLFCKVCIRYKTYMCKKIIKDNEKERRDKYYDNRNNIIQWTIINYFIKENNYYKDYNNNLYSYNGMIRIIKNNYKYFSKEYKLCGK